MPHAKAPRIPSYRLHKPTGLAVVRLNGKDFYLGPYGTAASHAEYDRIVGEWVANGRRLPSMSPVDADLLIVELIAQYFAHAKHYYVKNGEPTRELNHIRQAMSHLQRLYGHTPVASFGPKALKSIRQSMIGAEHSRRPGRKLSRTYVNDMIGRIKRMFRWTRGRELARRSRSASPRISPTRVSRSSCTRIRQKRFAR